MDIIPIRTFSMVKDELGVQKSAILCHRLVCFGKNRVDQNLICRRYDIINYNFF